MRLLLLLAAASCAFVSAGIAFGWALFDLDDPALRGDASGYLAISAMAVALAFAWEPLKAFVRQFA